MNVKYVSSGKSPSGYASAARADIAALFCAGVNVSCSSIQQTAEATDYGIEGAIMNSLEGKKLPHKIQIIHLTPDLLPDYKEQGVYTIARLAWETDKLPKQWIEPLNQIDEIWTMSRPMADMIKASGVTTMCSVIPEPINVSWAEEQIEPFILEIPKDFIFYTIGQWIDRKNFKTLLRAYWKEFSGQDNVSLLIKTYRVNYSQEEWKILRSEIETWRKEVKQAHYPKVLLAKNLFTEDQMWRFHTVGDCYVNPSSGEGWARPLQEAMVLAKPCISGNNGGITDYLTNQYYMVSSSPQRATEVSHIPWYTQDMHWKTISEDGLQKAMREVYEDRFAAQKKGKAAQTFVVENFSYQKVGEMMKERLHEIEKVI